jgi:hypothetical protein
MVELKITKVREAGNRFMVSYCYKNDGYPSELGFTNIDTSGNPVQLEDWVDLIGQPIFHHGSALQTRSGMIISRNPYTQLTREVIEDVRRKAAV